MFGSRARRCRSCGLCARNARGKLRHLRHCREGWRSGGWLATAVATKERNKNLRAPQHRHQRPNVGRGGTGRVRGLTAAGLLCRSGCIPTCPTVPASLVARRHSTSPVRRVWIYLLPMWLRVRRCGRSRGEADRVVTAMRPNPKLSRTCNSARCPVLISSWPDRRQQGRQSRLAGLQPLEPFRRTPFRGRGTAIAPLGARRG